MRLFGHGVPADSGRRRGAAGGSAVYEGLLDAEHLSLDGLQGIGHARAGPDRRRANCGWSCRRKRRPVQVEALFPAARDRSAAARSGPIEYSERSVVSRCGEWRARVRTPFGLRR
jgi:hypothetical protein